MAATRKQRLERVLREVKAEYGRSLKLFSEADQPLAFIDFQFMYGSSDAIVWEAGPFDWAIDISHKLNEKFRRDGVNIFVEPYTGWALGVYLP